MNKNKKIYVTPTIVNEWIEGDSFIAASGGITSGGTDGRGDHGISGAKESAYLFEDDMEEEYEEDVWAQAEVNMRLDYEL